jgi:hypothetical protein
MLLHLLGQLWDEYEVSTRLDVTGVLWISAMMHFAHPLFLASVNASVISDWFTFKLGRAESLTRAS